MEEPLTSPRNYCALGGALQTISAINGAVPIVHSGSACCLRLHEGMSTLNGYQGNGYSGGSAIPNSNVHRNGFIFGSENRLDELVQATIDVMDGELYVIMNGCSMQLSGENINSTATLFREQGYAVTALESGGFTGSAIDGYEDLCIAIMEYYSIHRTETIPKRVNLWMDIPGFHPFWNGHYSAISKLLTQLGVSVNVLFGYQSSLEHWKSALSAECNLLLSPWAGLKIVQYMKDKYDIPFLHFPFLPIGKVMTSLFLSETAKFMKLSSEKVQTLIKYHEDFYNYHYRQAIEYMSIHQDESMDYHVIAGDSHYSLSFYQFLSKETNVVPGKIFITDNPSKTHQKMVKELCLDTDVIFTQELSCMEKELCAYGGLKPFIIGSDWENALADKYNGRCIALMSPVSNRLVLNTSYAGYEGGLRLMEAIMR